MMKKTKLYYAWDQLPMLVTAREAACVLRVGEPTIRSMMRDGRLHGVKIGRSWLIERDGLRKFAEGGDVA